MFWLLGASTYGAERSATPVSSIVVHEGFQVELLRSAQEGEDSWISMTFDDRGRVILGLDQKGIARLTLADDPAEVEFEKIEETFLHCRGVLYAHDSLYVSATDSMGFYRLRDTNGDDQFDESELWKKLDYRSRFGHGGNQVVLGPDDMIYLVNGNDISFPDGVSPTSAYSDPRNDILLPNPHDAGEDDRVGHIIRISPDGDQWEVMAGGMRNQVDIAFNSEGEMFTFDADMEWDVGQPWYRPTRVNHVVSGGEYGWRWGTGKWPVYYEDSLPTTLDTGLSSPTGMVFGTSSRFPERYRNALFMGDWQNGRILLVDLIPSGASYTAQYEVFAEGGPMNVCDLEFGPDGALYFITGGRHSQAGLYRIVSTNTRAAVKPPPLPNEATIREARAARSLRHKLESFHTRQDATAIDQCWPHLDSRDRWLRFAARIAIENQDSTLWRQRALDESRPTAAIAGLIALCRCGDPADLGDVLDALGRLDMERMEQEQLLGLLRAYQLCFVRLGDPPVESTEEIVSRLDALYPHPTSSANHMLGDLLVYLRAEKVIEKTVPFLQDQFSQEEQIRAVRSLTHVTTGWTMDARRELLNWLKRMHSVVGGHLLSQRVGEIKDDYLASFSAAEQRTFQSQIDSLNEPIVPSDASAGETETTSGRPLVRQWTLEDLEPRLTEATSNRSYGNGRRALLAANCLQCHRFGQTGAPIGPDLTTVGRRFDERAILESILLPSQVMDPKYRYSTYLLNNGKAVTGRPLQVDNAEIKVETDALRHTAVIVSRSDIEESFPSQSSPMPSGLLDILTADEILDLLALLKSGGDRESEVFVGP